MIDNQLLIEAAQQGNLAEVLRLIVLSDPKAQSNEALEQAARHGHVKCVEALIPVSSPKFDNSFALWIAACQGQTDCVAKLIPVSGVKDGVCRALNVAARNGHIGCVHLLLPLHTQKELLGAISGPILGNHLSVLKELADGIKDPSALLPYFRKALYDGKWEIADVFYDATLKNLTSSRLSDIETSYPEYFAHKQKLVLENHVCRVDASKMGRQRKI